MKCAALVLASGLSARYGKADKLLADLKGKALLAYTLDAITSAKFNGYFVITPQNEARAHLAKQRRFEVIHNPDPAAGQGHSIAIGAKHIINTGFDCACVLLGDMPMIMPEYLGRLKRAAESADVVFSRADNRNQPPAIFRGEALQALTTLSGDKGARSLDWNRFKVKRIDLPDDLAVDFDTPEDFRTL